MHAMRFHAALAIIATLIEFQRPNESKTNPAITESDLDQRSLKFNELFASMRGIFHSYFNL